MVLAICIERNSLCWFGGGPNNLEKVTKTRIRNNVFLFLGGMKSFFSWKESDFFLFFEVLSKSFFLHFFCKKTESCSCKKPSQRQLRDRWATLKKERIFSFSSYYSPFPVSIFYNQVTAFFWEGAFECLKNTTSQKKKSAFKNKNNKAIAKAEYQPFLLFFSVLQFLFFAKKA